MKLEFEYPIEYLKMGFGIRSYQFQSLNFNKLFPPFVAGMETEFLANKKVYSNHFDLKI